MLLLKLTLVKHAYKKNKVQLPHSVPLTQKNRQKKNSTYKLYLKGRPTFSSEQAVLLQRPSYLQLSFRVLQHKKLMLKGVKPRETNHYVPLKRFQSQLVTTQIYSCFLDSGSECFTIIIKNPCANTYSMPIKTVNKSFNLTILSTFMMEVQSCPPHFNYCSVKMQLSSIFQ